MSANGAADGVAIIGLACLFPGAPDVDAYWRNILNRFDAISEPPPEAWDTAVYYAPGVVDTDRVYCQRGGYLGSLVSFDPLQYGVPPASVGGEPDQWLALKLAHDAMVDAGYAHLDEQVRKRTAVILGKGTYLNGGNAVAIEHGLVIGQTIEILKTLHSEYTEADLEALRQAMKKALPPMTAQTVPGLIPNIIVGRIANRLDLMGPTYTVDAACASSLVAVQHALGYLRSGECDLALVGGAQVWVPVPTLNVFCQLGALSRRQQIRPFDKDADGTLLGEGIGMVVLKRLADAERDDDRIYAVIRAVGVASDGREVSVLAPRVEGEELALRRAYEAAQVSTKSIGLIEAHGTGTPVGDVVEMEALRRVFGGRDGGLPRCAIGSVKSMISHTMPAAGVASLIKTSLALYHKVLPPTLHCDEPNPKLEIEQTPFYLNTLPRPWIHGGDEPRRAGINAFGFGGINAHLVLEEHTDQKGALSHVPPWDSEVCILEAESPDALLQQARHLTSVVESTLAGPSRGDPRRLRDLAYTLVRELGHSATSYRLAIVASSLADLGSKLGRATRRLADPGCQRIQDVSGIYYSADPLGRTGKLVFLFPGEGAQYPNMLADLCLHFPEVRQWFDRSDRLFCDHPRAHVLSDYLFPRPTFAEADRLASERRLWDIDLAIEAVLTANQALLSVMHGLRIQPDAIVGHSSGEYSALSAAGALDLTAEFLLSLHQSYEHVVAEDGVPRAVLLAVGAEREQVEALAGEVGGPLFVAMDNCPHQTVLVGDAASSERVVAVARARDLICERLTFDRPYHTPLFAPYVDHLRDIYARARLQPPHVPVYSCATAAPYPSRPEDIRSLMLEQWVRPVEFRQTIETLYAEGARLFVEVGPRGNLSTFAEDILRGRLFAAVPANIQRRSGIDQLNHLVGRLAAHGVRMDPTFLHDRRGSATIDWAQAAESADHGAPSMRTVLTTGWPMLRLAPGVVKPQPAASPPATAPNGTDSAMHAYLQTMDEFLAIQNQVMQGLLAAHRPAEDSATDYPLLGRSVEDASGEHVVFERAFDMAEDLYLRDHTLGRSVSVVDAGLSALAVMPLAMSLEMIAEAGAWLAPGQVVVGLRDVRANRWLAWPYGKESQILRVDARRISDEPNSIQVQIRNRTEDEASQPAPDSPVVEATVLVADRYPSAPAGDSQFLMHGRPSRWSADGVYVDGMFHGLSWQGVNAIQRTDQAGAVATLRVLSFEGFFRNGAAPRFILDPVVLDAAGQVIGLWTQEHLVDGQVIFPFRAAAIEVYGPSRAAGEQLTCLAAIQHVDTQRIRSDLDVVAGDGSVWFRIRGWEDKRFFLPVPFAALASPAQKVDVSTPWLTPIAQFADVTKVHCRRIPIVPFPDRSFWSRVWAHRILGRRERVEFDALAGSEALQFGWLAGRAAAKEAIRALLRTEHGRDVALADIEIAADRDGQLVVSGSWEASAVGQPVVALAQTDEWVVAQAGLAARRLSAVDGQVR